ncbi:hypothetical protein F383_03519 [Gossypium arboreum]|uniref:Uncharacterized protein n=1 Tax=Gossypium arboreum TaxID=29729 RepID=A0A0B0NWV4_GOSAR|nr:hypothetical protein F383_03519 [Gossypium arboreum]
MSIDMAIPSLCTMRLRHKTDRHENTLNF